MAPFTLPDLAFDHSALEPHISGRIMELHHSEHHAAYVRNANAAMDRLAEARADEDVSVVGALERQLAFNLSGHVLHSLFWRNLSPESDTVERPSGELADRIDRDFGGFPRFRAEMTETAASITGSGWAALCWEPCGGRLIIEQIHDHHAQLVPGAAPIMVIDAWEHAYYLKYENRKKEYFEAIWRVWNWSDIANLFADARAGRRTESNAPAI